MSLVFLETVSVIINNEADAQTKNNKNLNYTKYTKKIECILYIFTLY